MKFQKNKPELSIVMPVFNEEKNLPLVLKRLKEIDKEANIEFLLVEDTGSTDNTRAEVKKLDKKYKFIRGIFTNKRGYGKSIHEGLKYAKADYVGWMHADMQTDPKELLKALKIIRELGPSKKVFIKGKRYGRPLMDKLINTIGMSLFETLILGKYLYDINAQPNIFHKDLFKEMKDPPENFSFDLYAYYLAIVKKYKVIRFPVFFGKRIHGTSVWDTGWKSRIKFIKRTIKFTFELKKRLRKNKL